MPNPDHTLLPGQFTRVRLLMDVREKAVTVPTKALVIEKGAAFLFVVRHDDVVEKRFVETGPETGNLTIIERGLAPGELVVTEGYHKLNHGMKVDPVMAHAENGAATPAVSDSIAPATEGKRASAAPDSATAAAPAPSNTTNH